MKKLINTGMGESDNLTNSVEENTSSEVTLSSEDDSGKLKKLSFIEDLASNNMICSHDEDATTNSGTSFMTNQNYSTFSSSRDTSESKSKKLRNCNSEDFATTAHCSNACDEGFTSLAFGEVIELNDKLKQYLQDSVDENDPQKLSTHLPKYSFNHPESSSTSSASSSDSSDSDENEDLIAIDDWRKEPRIGPEFQVTCIPLMKQQDPDYDVNTDQSVWNPSQIEPDGVENYLKFLHTSNSKAQSKFSKLFTPDSEDALLLLTQCNYDVCEATKRCRFRPSPVASELDVWSAEESRQFEHGLTLYGKNFRKIHRNKVKTKSIGEIVKFYYLWKKSRMPKSQVKTRLGKKKEAGDDSDYVESPLNDGGTTSATFSLSVHPSIPLQPDSEKNNLNPDRRPGDVTQDRIPDLALSSGNRDVTEDNVLRDFDFPKHIVPESDDSSMESFDDFDPPIFVAYTDFGSFAPVATTIVHQTVDSEIMDESPSCVLPDVSSEVHNSSVATKQYIPQWQCSNFFSPSNSILPPDVVTSTEDLKNTYSTNIENTENDIQNSNDFGENCSVVLSPLPNSVNILNENTSTVRSMKNEIPSDTNIVFSFGNKLVNSISTSSRNESDENQNHSPVGKETISNLKKTKTSNINLEPSDIPSH